MLDRGATAGARKGRFAHLLFLRLQNGVDGFAQHPADTPRGTVRRRGGERGCPLHQPQGSSNRCAGFRLRSMLGVRSLKGKVRSLGFEGSGFRVEKEGLRVYGGNDRDLHGSRFKVQGAVIRV